MRFLCIGDEMMHTALAWRLHVEGNEVKCFIGKPKYRKKLDGMVAKAPSLLAGLAWVGKDGVVISDDETDVSDIRRRGYRVVGGNLWIKRLENDRAFQNQIAKQAGVRTPDFHKMTDINEAIKFVKDNPDAYVLKQMGHAPKCYNFVGKEDDGSDV